MMTILVPYCGAACAMGKPVLSAAQVRRSHARVSVASIELIYFVG